MQFECIAKMANLSQYCTSFVGTGGPFLVHTGGKREEKESIQLHNYQGYIPRTTAPGLDEELPRTC
jgi:hypothetical protein